MHSDKSALELTEISKLKTMRTIKQALFKKFIPMLNQIHFLNKTNDLMEDKMSLQIAGQNPVVPQVNPFSSDLSGELLHEIS
jgi:hypothetical protein